MAKLIEFEGIDGSGKTTAFNYVAEALKKKGFNVLTTREVGSPHIPLCVELRKLILNPDTEMDGRAMEYVFAAMRLENQRFYKTVADKYDFILCDRGWFSHLAYTDHNVDKKFTREFYLQNVAPITRLPDEVVFLDVDPDIAASRRKTRGEVADAIEAKGNEFQKGVYRSFKDYMAMFSSIPVTQIDAEQDLPNVQLQLDRVISRLFDENHTNAEQSMG